MHLQFITSGTFVAATVSTIVSMTCFGAEPDGDKWTQMPDSKIGVTFAITSPTGASVDGRSNVVFSSRYAVSSLLDPNAPKTQNWDSAVLYDLEKMAWYDVDRRLWVDFESCKTWERASIERTKKSLASSQDADLKAFVEAMINPGFHVRKNQDGTLVLSNSHLTYSITPAADVTPDQLERFIAYDRLNAYHKAINERQLPPTAQMDVDDILARERTFPTQLTAIIKTGGGNIAVTTNMRVEQFDSSDAEIIRKALATVQP